jgi:hypothetical protein
MKIEELRIGNYVTITPHKENDVMKIDCEDFKNLLEFKTFDRLKPIPLTEKWLLKLGFKETKEDKEIKWFVKNRLEIVIGEVNFTVYDHLVLKHIKSVHELQNLHYALTKKELTL